MSGARGTALQLPFIAIDTMGQPMTLKADLADAACKRSYVLSKLRFTKRLRRKWKARAKAPVVVHTMGKVGSTSVCNAIAQAQDERPVFHTHFLSDYIITRLEADSKALFRSHQEQLSLPLLWRSAFLQQQIKAAADTGEWKFVTLTRDPVARNVSAFFENIYLTPARSNGTIHVAAPLYGIDTEIPAGDTDILVELFLTRWSDHAGPAQFYEREFGQVLGLDLYAQAFDHASGYQIYAGNGVNALLIRLEDMNGSINRVLEDFIEVPGIELTHENPSAGKPYGDLYKNLIARLRLDDDYLDEMYGSRYARHFYTAAELGRFRRRWSRPA